MSGHLGRSLTAAIISMAHGLGISTVAEGVVSGPSDAYGDAVVIACPDRSYREPGVAYPGLEGLRVWDGNPQRFELNPDGLNLRDVALFAGTPFAAEGVLSYSYGAYQLLPTVLELGAAPDLPRSIRRGAAGEALIASQNLERLFACVIVRRRRTDL